MTPLHTRLFGLLATGWGGLLVYFYSSSRVKNYLDLSFHHFIMIGGLGMIVLGLYSLICPREQSCHQDHSSCGHDHHDHDHQGNHHHDDEHQCDHHHDEGHGPFVTILLTVIPLTVAMTYSKDSLSNVGLSKKGLYESPNLMAQAELPPFTREDLEKNYSKNAQGEFQLSLISAYYAAGDREIQDIFDGLPVEFEGRIAPEKVNNESGKRLRIFREIITCCAADLQVVGVSLEFPDESERPALDSWVRAGGTLTFERVGENVVPLLKIREVVPAEEPYSEFLRRQ